MDTASWQQAGFTRVGHLGRLAQRVPNGPAGAGPVPGPGREPGAGLPAGSGTPSLFCRGLPEVLLGESVWRQSLRDFSEPVRMLAGVTHHRHH